MFDKRIQNAQADKVNSVINNKNLKEEDIINILNR